MARRSRCSTRSTRKSRSSFLSRHSIVDLRTSRASSGPGQKSGRSQNRHVRRPRHSMLGCSSATDGSTSRAPRASLTGTGALGVPSNRPRAGESARCGEDQAGEGLRIREPEWHEHRPFKGRTPTVNLHVFSQQCGGRPHGGLPRLVAACNESERELYAHAKSELARKSWRYVQNYADAKSALVEEIMVRAQEAREWAPEPRAPHPSPAPARARRSCPG
jgi:hypothetical protein